MTVVVSAARTLLNAGSEILTKPDGIYHVTEEVRKVLDAARLAFSALVAAGGKVGAYSAILSKKIIPVTTCLGGAAGLIDFVNFVSGLNYFHRDFIGDISAKRVHSILVNAGYTALGAVCTVGFAAELGILQLGKLAAGVLPAIFGALTIAYSIDLIASTYTTVKDYLRADQKAAALENLKKGGSAGTQEPCDAFEKRSIKALQSQIVREYVVKTIKLAVGIIFAVSVLTTLAFPMGGVGLAIVIPLGIAASGTAIVYEIFKTQAVRNFFNNWYLGKEYAERGVLAA